MIVTFYTITIPLLLLSSQSSDIRVCLGISIHNLQISTFTYYSFLIMVLPIDFVIVALSTLNIWFHWCCISHISNIFLQVIRLSHITYLYTHISSLIYIHTIMIIMVLPIDIPYTVVLSTLNIWLDSLFHNPSWYHILTNDYNWFFYFFYIVTIYNVFLFSCFRIWLVSPVYQNKTLYK